MTKLKILVAVREDREAAIILGLLEHCRAIEIEPARIRDWAEYSANLSILKPDVCLTESWTASSAARKAVDPDWVPIVYLSTLPSVEEAMRELRAGAVDYLVVGELTAGTLERAIYLAPERLRILKRARA